MKNAPPLLSEVIKALSGNSIAQAIGFFTTMIIARTITVEQFGQYFFFTNTFLLCTQLIDLGMSSTYPAMKQSFTDGKFFSRLIAFRILLGACFGFFVGVILFDRFVWSLAFSLAIPAFSVFNLVLLDKQADRMYATLSALKVIYYTTGAAFVIAIASTTENHNIERQHFYLAAYFLCPLMAAAIAIKKYNIRWSNLKIDTQFTREIFSYTKWAFFASFAVILMQRAEILLLKYFSDTENVAAFALGTQFSMAIGLITSSINPVLLSHFSKENQRKSHRQLQKLTIPFLAVLPILILCAYGFSSTIVPLIAGQKYAPHSTVIALLIISSICGMMVTPLSALLYSTGRSKIVSQMNWLQLFILIFMDTLLTPIYGALGAAISAIAIRLFGWLYLIFTIYRSPDPLKC